ncbi:MAG: DUF483 domain-containing protein [Candidatus Bathyarchaeota archaeon]
MSIAEATRSARILDLNSRLKLEYEIVKKYNPPVRPALDPEFALTIQLYSLNPYDVGSFLGYPYCCVKSFVEECRQFFDKKHFEELKHLKRKQVSVILTAGFVPCSLNCINAMNAALISHLTDTSLIKKMDEELKVYLPHHHPAYQSFFEELA